MRHSTAIEALRCMAESKHLPPRRRQTLAAIADYVQDLGRRNKAAQHRARNYAKALGRVEISGPVDVQAELIADMASEYPVTVVKTGKRTMVSRKSPRRNAALIGTYDEGCDVRDIAEDLAA